MIDIEVFMRVLLLLSLVVLVVTLIVLVIKIINTIKKVDDLIFDVQTKSNKLNGVFDIANNVTNAITTVSDKLGSFVSDKIISIVKKKGDIDE